MTNLSGIIGLVIFVLDIWVILQVFQSNRDNLNKALWIALIFFLPVLGLIIWFIWGPTPER